MSAISKYTEALNNYYSKKDKYSEKVKKVLKDLKDLKDGGDVKTKIKCVKCGKKGGTTFERVVERENGKKQVYLIAKCASNTPCDLDINIKLANYKSYDDLVKELHDKLEIIKADIIKLKLDLLFNLKDEDYVVSKFEKLKDNLIKLNGKLDKLRNTYDEKNNTFVIKSKTKAQDGVDGDEYENSYNRTEALEYINKEIEETLSNYNKSMKKYKETNRDTDLMDVFSQFTKNLTTLFDKRREIKYQEVNIEKEKIAKNIYKNTFSFKQTSIENKEVLLSPFEIVKNVY